MASSLAIRWWICMSISSVVPVADVDSSEAAFKMAAIFAMKEAVPQCDARSAGADHRLWKSPLPTSIKVT